MTIKRRLYIPWRGVKESSMILSSCRDSSSGRGWCFSHLSFEWSYWWHWFLLFLWLHHQHIFLSTTNEPLKEKQDDSYDRSSSEEWMMHTMNCVVEVVVLMLMPQLRVNRTRLTNVDWQSNDYCSFLVGIGVLGSSSRRRKVVLFDCRESFAESAPEEECCEAKIEVSVYYWLKSVTGIPSEYVLVSHTFRYENQQQDKRTKREYDEKRRMTKAETFKVFKQLACQRESGRSSCFLSLQSTVHAYRTWVKVLWNFNKCKV